LVRTARLCLDPLLTLAVLLISLTLSPTARADDPVKGVATFSVANGFARLVFKLADDVETEVSAAGSIVVIRFKRPVDIPVEKLADAVPDYVGMARRDPDGTAIRLSLSRRVTINTMTAAERIFIDFLPDGWAGPPPPLPTDVIRDRAERARAAERALRTQRAADAAKRKPPVRVRASVQPTFVRFVFEVPDGVSASSVLNEQKLTLLFNNVLSFDLADAKVAAPPNVASINQRSDTDTSAVDINLIGEVDVRSFREDKNYVVDVAFQQPEKPGLGGHAANVPLAPAKPVVAVAAGQGKAIGESTPLQQPAPIAPVTSEAFAEQAKIAIRPGQPANAPQAEPPPAAENTAPATPTTQPALADVPSRVPDKVAQALPTAPPAQAVPAEPPKPAEASVNEASPPPANAAPKEVAAPSPQDPSAGKPVMVEAQRDSDGLRMTFGFAKPVASALFRRADAVWLVVDSTEPIDIAPIRDKAGAIISDISRFALDRGQAIRFRLNRPQMPSLEADDRSLGTGWTVTFADRVQKPPQPLMVVRNVSDPALANVSVPLANPGQLHRLLDPDAGDVLWVVTAPPPARGFIRRQDFVELSLLESVHGVVVHPNSDDVRAEVGTDKVVLGRPGGLTLSSADVAAERATAAVKPLFDAEEWKNNQAENFLKRLDALIAASAAATTSPEQLAQARLNLAKFYVARAMYEEAHGVANLMLSESKRGAEDPGALMIHAASGIMMGRPERAIKDLANPVIGNGYDSQLWKGLAFARQGKWADAREKFKNAEFSVATLPPDLQRIVMLESMKAALEVKDFAGAARRRSELEVIGVPKELKAAAAVLRGRLAEALGYEKDALDAYRFAGDSPDRQAAAEGKLLEITLKQKRGEITQAEILRELELLAVMWRGDGIELRTLQILAKIYSDTGRYAEAFAATRAATRLHPNSIESRQAQDAASALFAQLFLGAAGDNIPPIDALAMFYEYRELTPIGRRGDEMIRRLADRLVSVDLLDQAAELLQYQVDKRLEGAARAQVAARLAMVYLTNRKPERAIAALRLTRISDLSGELRQQRLLLEARAQSDIGRHDLALDIVSNIPGREAIRLRSDIYWAQRQWREASEQIELYYGDRWRDFTPLNPAEKGDIIRAVVGYALAEDAIGLSRFREKYAPLMSGDGDRTAFDVASKPAAANSAEFSQIARMAASVDTLDGFIRDMKLRFPDATARAPLPDPIATGAVPSAKADSDALPAIVGVKRASAAQ
jgi:tetratricopeptide (TPR) repeat protein